MKATYVDHMGSDLTVVNAARVSFGKKNVYFEEKDKKLIGYLADHGHYSPFGHCFASFHVKAPIFVSRQLVKHKFLRINEVSRRYVEDEPDFFIPEVWRGKAKNKKQGSEGLAPIPDYLKKMVEMDIKSALITYNTLLDNGVAPEQARMVLPLNTYTEWYWSGSLDAFAAMANLRLKDDTQEETREIAKQISTKMKELFPVSWEALVKE